MKLYWACAKTADLELLSTYDSCMSIEEAGEQFYVWEDEYGYKLTEMWISEYEDGKKIRDIAVEKRTVIV